jgi:hypothetical protein
VYRIAKDPGYTIDLYVDETTGQYRRAVIDPDGNNRATLDILQYTSRRSGIPKWKTRPTRSAILP